MTQAADPAVTHVSCESMDGSIDAPGLIRGLLRAYPSLERLDLETCYNEYVAIFEQAGMIKDIRIHEKNPKEDIKDICLKDYTAPGQYRSITYETFVGRDLTTKVIECAFKLKPYN